MSGSLSRDASVNWHASEADEFRPIRLAVNSSEVRPAMSVARWTRHWNRHWEKRGRRAELWVPDVNLRVCLLLLRCI